jgi:hypothetical protein
MMTIRKMNLFFIFHLSWPHYCSRLTLLAAVAVGLFLATQVGILREYDTLGFGSSSSSSSSSLDMPRQSTIHNPNNKGVASRSVTLPQRLLHRYQLEHSHQVLVRENQTDKASFRRRRFLMAPYHCPFSVGNVFHEVMGFAIVAMVTNRTLLWFYKDAKSCNQRFRKPSWCIGIQPKEDCDAL